MRVILAISVMFFGLAASGEDGFTLGLGQTQNNQIIDRSKYGSDLKFTEPTTLGLGNADMKLNLSLERMEQIRKEASKAIPEIKPTEDYVCTFPDNTTVTISFKEAAFSEAINKAKDKCDSAGRTVGLSCNIAQYAPMATQAIQNMASSSMGGDPKKACEDAEKLADISGALNGGFGGACMRTSSVCMDNCGTMRTTYENASSAIRESASKVNAAIAKKEQLKQQYTVNARTAGLRDETVDGQTIKGKEQGKTDIQWTVEAQDMQNSISTCRDMLRDKEADASKKNDFNRNEAGEKHAKCEQMGQYAGGALAQSFASLATKMQAQNCQKFYAASDCKSLEDLRTKPMCKPVLCDCMSGAYRTFAECGDYRCDVDCTKTENQQLQVCFCKANPGDPACPGGGGPNGNGTGGPVITGGTNPNGDTFTNGLNGGFSDDQIKSLLADENAPEQNPFGDKKDGSSSGSGQQMQPGAPFAAGGGSNYQGNPAVGGKGGAGKGSYNTDILGGAPGANGGAFGSGGAYPIGGNGEANNRNGLNLKDFLPGGKGAQRALAGKLELEKNGISEANGLSNWQKVNRQMKTFQQGRQILVTP